MRDSNKAKARSAWLLLPLVLQVGLAQAADAGVLTPCTIEGVGRQARCGVLQVAENPRLPEGRTIGIHVVVVSAAGAARPDPVVVLMGGPGEDASSVASERCILQLVGNCYGSRSRPSFRRQRIAAHRNHPTPSRGLTPLGAAVATA